MAIIPASTFEQGTELSPSFDIFIEGKDASAANPLFEVIRPLISSVTYEEDEEMAALFTLSIINQPDIKLGLGSKIDWRAVLDCKAFAEGNAVDLFMGYAGIKTYMGRVEIIKWMPDFPSSGPTEFTIKGYDARHRMMTGNQVKMKTAKVDKVGKSKSSSGVKQRQLSIEAKTKGAKGSKGSAQKKKHTFQNLTDDLIVAKIAAKYGFAADCDPAEKGLASMSAKASSSGFIVAGGKKYDMTTAKGKAEYAAFKANANASGNVAPKEKESKSSPRRTSAVPSRIQIPDQTDWQFLQRLASINRFDLWVDYDLGNKQWTVHFKQRKAANNAGYTFTYNGIDGSLLEAHPDFSLKEQSTSAEVLYFDSKNKSIELTTIEDTKKEENVNFKSTAPGDLVAKKSIGAGARVRFTAFGQSLEAIADKPFRSKKEAEAFVADWLKEKERDLIILTGKVVGMEDLRPRQVHEFIGMSTRLDGFYRLTQVKHNMTAGQPFTVDFIAHKILSEEITRRKPTTKAKVKTTKQTVKSDSGQILGKST
jgi:phage protein D